LKHWGLQCVRTLFAHPDRWGSVLHSVGTRGLIVWLYPDCLPFSGAHCSQNPFSFNWKQSLQYVFKKEGDDRAKNAALFFLACEANPNTRPSIPAAMRAKGTWMSRQRIEFLYSRCAASPPKINPKILLVLSLQPHCRYWPWRLWRRQIRRQRRQPMSRCHHRSVRHLRVCRLLK
jgi:hypothetical protein